MNTQENLSELQKLLLVSPQADKVYFNEAGDYQLSDHPEYQHQILTREEVLEATEEVLEATEEAVEGDATAPNKKKRN